MPKNKEIRNTEENYFWHRNDNFEQKRTPMNRQNLNY